MFPLVTCGYLRVTSGYFVVTSGYLVATTGYFMLLLVLDLCQSSRDSNTSSVIPCPLRLVSVYMVKSGLGLEYGDMNCQYY